MADEPAFAPDQGFPANGEDTSPAVGLITQYVKDLSFENPNAPMIFQSQAQPRIDVQFNIGSSVIGDGVYEVVLKIDAKASVDDQVAFVVDLSYAGLFGVRNVPEDQLQPFLLAEAPRLIFPFARRVVADVTRDGNYPPLMLEPIDFGALYMAQAQDQFGALQGEPAGQA
ncbi:protein-export chaperone SecB [Sphingomonas jatrophae]|uniref:Protein-export protein SecB n=1 Tax=Sphingomonas jatrophae TaxID=1166337 RepID=A0A1I6K494_9SPHN|nr:protein-export chaperone SecB [Sphingomonas jatrophae]SFR86042.1 protein translocase subunit secB [Sphingomonas jatrophae]